MDNVKTEQGQVIGIILCIFTNCSIIYPVVAVYYCPGHTSNTKLHVENIRSILVYTKGRATRVHILKRFTPYLIK